MSTTTITEGLATGSATSAPLLIVSIERADAGATTAPHVGKPVEQLAVDGPEPPAERNEAEDETGYPTGAKFYLILVSIGLVLVFGALDSSIVAVAVPSITDQFHSVADVGWYSAAFRLAMCSTQFIFGKLYKIFSVKRVFLVSVFIFVVSSVLCASAPTSSAFVLARAVNGLGTAGILSGCFTLIVQCLPLRKRPIYTGIFGAIEGVSFMASPTLGGIIIDKLGWRWCFWISVPSGMISLAASSFFLSDVKPALQLTWWEKLSELDLLGTVVFIPSLTCLFLALSWAGIRYAWNSPTIIGLFCAFAVLLGLFVYEQYRKGDSATLPPRILRNRSVVAGFVFAVCCNSAMTVVEYVLYIILIFFSPLLTMPLDIICQRTFKRCVSTVPPRVAT